MASRPIPPSLHVYVNPFTATARDALPVPSCTHCRHYVPPHASRRRGKCALFYVVDLVDGERICDDARLCRTTPERCGVVPRFFAPIHRHERAWRALHIALSHALGRTLRWFRDVAGLFALAFVSACAAYIAAHFFLF